MAEGRQAHPRQPSHRQTPRPRRRSSFFFLFPFFLSLFCAAATPAPRWQRHKRRCRAPNARKRTFKRRAKCAPQQPPLVHPRASEAEEARRSTIWTGDAVRYMIYTALSFNQNIPGWSQTEEGNREEIGRGMATPSGVACVHKANRRRAEGRRPACP